RRGVRSNSRNNAPHNRGQRAAARAARSEPAATRSSYRKSRAVWFRSWPPSLRLRRQNRGRARQNDRGFLASGAEVPRSAFRSRAVGALSCYSVMVTGVLPLTRLLNSSASLAEMPKPVGGGV